jgi:hypothetical protein
MIFTSYYGVTIFFVHAYVTVAANDAPLHR